MYCVNCGHKITTGAKFCANCGKDLSNSKGDTIPNKTEKVTLENASESAPANKRLVEPIYIYYAIALIIGYIAICAMFVPEYGDPSPFLLLVSAFLINVFTIKKLKVRGSQQVFILITFCTFVAVLFYSSAFNDAGNALFLAMMTTFINLIISYVSYLLIVITENSKKYKEQANG